MQKLNGLTITPGERFRTKANGRFFKINHLEGPIAIVIDEATGKKWAYGVEALKRLDADVIGEAGKWNKEPSPHSMED